MLPMNLDKSKILLCSTQFKTLQQKPDLKTKRLTASETCYRKKRKC